MGHSNCLILIRDFSGRWPLDSNILGRDSATFNLEYLAANQPSLSDFGVLAVLYFRALDFGILAVLYFCALDSRDLAVSHACFRGFADDCLPGNGDIPISSGGRMWRNLRVALPGSWSGMLGFLSAYLSLYLCVVSLP